MAQADRSKALAGKKVIWRRDVYFRGIMAEEILVEWHSLRVPPGLIYYEGDKLGETISPTRLNHKLIWVRKPLEAMEVWGRPSPCFHLDFAYDQMYPESDAVLEAIRRRCQDAFWLYWGEGPAIAMRLRQVEIEAMEKCLAIVEEWADNTVPTRIRQEIQNARASYQAEYFQEPPGEGDPKGAEGQACKEPEADTPTSLPLAG